MGHLLSKGLRQAQHGATGIRTLAVGEKPWPETGRRAGEGHTEESPRPRDFPCLTALPSRVCSACHQGPAPPRKHRHPSRLPSVTPAPNEDARWGGELVISHCHALNIPRARAALLIYPLLSDGLHCSSNKNIFTWMVIKLNLVY